MRTIVLWFLWWPDCDSKRYQETPGKFSSVQGAVTEQSVAGRTHSEPCVHALSTLNAKHQQPFQVQAGMRCVSGVSLLRFRLFLKNLSMCLRIFQVQATGNFLNTPGRISSCSGNIIPVCGHTLHVYIRLAPTKLKWQTF